MKKVKCQHCGNEDHNKMNYETTENYPILENGEADWDNGEITDTKIYCCVCEKLSDFKGS